MKPRSVILLTISALIIITAIIATWLTIPKIHRTEGQKTKTPTLLDIINKSTKSLVNVNKIYVTVSGNLSIYAQLSLSRSTLEFFAHNNNETPTRICIYINETGTVEYAVGRVPSREESYMYVLVPQMNLILDLRYYTTRSSEAKEYKQRMYLNNSLEFIDTALRNEKLRICLMFRNVTVIRPKEEIFYLGNLTCVESKLTSPNTSISFVNYFKQYVHALTKLSLEILRDIAREAKFVGTEEIAGHETYCYRIRARIDLAKILSSEKVLTILIMLAEMNNMSTIGENASKIVLYSKFIPLMLRLLGLDLYTVRGVVCVEHRTGVILYLNVSLENVNRQYATLILRLNFNVSKFSIKTGNITIKEIEKLRKVNATESIRLPLTIAQVLYTLTELMFNEGTINLALSSMLSGIALASIADQVLSYNAQT